MAAFRRNIGRPQQVVRIVMGLAVAVAAPFLLTGLPAWLIAAAGIMFAVTGGVGYCPACAVAGIGQGGQS